MREITKIMIDMYDMKNLRYDFMGYNFKKLNELSFHHLVVPKRKCREEGLGKGYQFWNGAILKQDTSHDYLHLIERIDRELFLRITKYMIEENTKGKIDIENLKRIREVLLLFESKYDTETDKNGKLLIKTPYKTDRIIL